MRRQRTLLSLALSLSLALLADQDFTCGLAKLRVLPVEASVHRTVNAMSCALARCTALKAKQGIQLTRGICTSLLSEDIEKSQSGVRAESQQR